MIPIVKCVIPHEYLLTVQFTDFKVDSIQNFLSKNKFIHKFRSNDIVNIQLHESEIPNVLYDISHLGVVLSGIEIKKPNLEDVFLEIARSKK